MRRRVTSVICTAGLLCAFGGYSSWLSAQAPEANSEQCVANPVDGYFTPVPPADAQTSELCFVRSEEISSFDQFVIVDISVRSKFQRSAIHAIPLPDWQIKTKSFLKRKPLLIVAEPYKRYSLAKLCKELVHSGFQSPKILIGGDFEESGRGRSASVPVDEFIVEVSKFGAVTIATDQDVAEQMIALGIPAITADPKENIASAVRDVAINNSLNGYLPVFIVGKSSSETELRELLNNEPENQVFVVSGGIESIERALKASTLNAEKRLHPNGVSICAG